MRVCINTSVQRFGGAVQVALSFINECRSYSMHDFIVWVGPGIETSLDTNYFPQNFTFRYFNFGVINFQRTISINTRLRKQEQIDNPDVIISTSGPSYFNSIAPQILGYNLPLYLYPESPFITRLSPYKQMRLWIKKMLHNCFFNRDALAFVVQTDDVNRRVVMQLNTSKVYTVTNTASMLFNQWKKYPNLLPPREGDKFRFVTISAYYPHKDLEIIPKIIEELKSRDVFNVEFVLTLKPSDFNEYIGIKDGILNVGPILPETCPSLYSECDGMFLPTLAECFSASYPEAMIMKKPIITTDLGFASCICGDAALYYEPMNPKSAADRIISLISDPKLQLQLKQAGTEQLKTFDTPKSRAEKYLKICQAAVNNQLDNLKL